MLVSILPPRPGHGTTRVAGVLAVLMLVAPASASSVIPMSLATLADHAGQVIVGEVASVRPHWADGPRRIQTEVVFEHVEYLKGKLADSGDTFVLLVPGGTVGELTLRLADTPVFAVGDKWVLFLLPEYKTYPVVGLAQGAFRVQTSPDGVARVYDAVGQPVAGFDADGFMQLAPGAQSDAAARLAGSKKLRVRAPVAQPPAQPLAYDEFLALLRPVLTQSRPHALAGPAGKPALVQQRSVPLRLAEQRAASSGGTGRVEQARQAVSARQSTRQPGELRMDAGGPPGSGRADP